MEDHAPAEKAYDLERLVFFSDGVFAIVITLLVIELHPPAGWDRTFAGLWRAEWRGLLAFVCSFLSVGAYWNVHRQLFRRIVRFHPGLVFFNLLLLGAVVLVPFAAELIFDSGPRGQPFAIFLAVIATVGLAQALLWGFAALVANVVEAKVSHRQRLHQLGMLMIAPVLLGTASVIAIYGSEKEFGWLMLIISVLAITRRVLLRRSRLGG